jgi:hypothetical protein
MDEPRIMGIPSGTKFYLSGPSTGGGKKVMMRCMFVYQTGPLEWEMEGDDFYELPSVFPEMTWRWNNHVDTAFKVSEVCYVQDDGYYEVYLKPFNIKTGELVHERGKH